MHASIPRLVVAGTSSGVGKTTVVSALLGALRRRGLKPAAFKLGPDYLDPFYHRVAADGPCTTLDAWMMGEQGVRRAFHQACAGADIAVLEGMMGLYDGLSPRSDEASTAQIAKWLDAPVVLIVDASAVARSIAALALGFKIFDPDVRFAGMICNRVGGTRHLHLLRETDPVLPILGGLPRFPEKSFPERHLGLQVAGDGGPDAALAVFWADQAQDHLDLDALVRHAAAAPSLPFPDPAVDGPAPTPCRIALADDAAFHFYYPDNLRALEAAGATLVRFSPLHDSALPPDIGGLILGGGYPESEAAVLSANQAMHAAIRGFVARGGYVYAECGGLMYLTQAIVTTQGARFPMVGLLPGDTVMHDRLQALGYQEVTTLRDTWLGPRGTRYRGHQFRYSDYRPPSPTPWQARVRPGNGQEDVGGHGSHRVCASYVHAHFASAPEIPRHMAAACAAVHP